MKALRIPLLRLAVALVGLVACGAALAQIRVGSIADARFGTGWTLDGGQMSVTRSKLLNTANFGPGGTVSAPITITDTASTVGSVNASLLSNFDVFFIGYLDDGNPNAFTGAELSAFQTWVNGGGTMIVTCDESGYDAVCSQFGFPATTSGTNPDLPTAAGLASPIFNGAFGSVASINECGTQGFFTTTAGASVLATDSSGSSNPIVLFATVGAGRVILIADVDTLSNCTLSAGTTITTNQDRFLGNLFAFAGNQAAAPPPVRVQVPTLSPAPLAVLMLALLFAGAVLNRRRGG